MCNMTEQISKLDVKVCINENAECDKATGLTSKLNLKVSTWMDFYSLQDETSDRLKMREACSEIAKTLYGKQYFISENGTFNEKFVSSAPFHLFLTTVENEKKTYVEPFSVTLHEILDYTTGEIIDSLHLNFYVEILYIINEYMLAAQVPKMTILYQKLVDPNDRFVPFDVHLVEIEMPQYENHHSKISILKYKDDKIRIIISTANLYARDWQTRTQGLWISPFLPLLPEAAGHEEGESKTNFKRDFLEYLDAYKQPEIFGWQALIHRTDCSTVNVFFIGSVPGKHELRMNKWGLEKLDKILSEHAILPSDTAWQWPVIAQSSAVGVFGSSYDNWIRNNIVNYMCRQKDEKAVFLPEFKFIFPSQKNFDESYDGIDGVSSLMYDRNRHLQQLWIKNYLYQWKADRINRTKAMPHSKCYMRLSPDENEIPWFVLTSANLSKGAWGKVGKIYETVDFATTKQDNYEMRQTFHKPVKYIISNYEAGVIFIPKFVIDRPSFYVKHSPDSAIPLFRVLYDLPLVKYAQEDEPYVIDTVSAMMPTASSGELAR